MGVSGIRRAFTTGVAMAVVVAASACSDVQDPIAFDPTPLTYTETFTGTLATGATAFHPFANTVAGTVVITLETVTPDPAQVVGIDIGTWDVAGCTPIFGTGSRSAVQGYSFAGSAIAANFCARIYDADSLIPADATVAYSIKVAHR